MRITSIVLVAAALAATPSLAQTMGSPDMACDEYLKLAASAGPTPKTGDAATDKMAADLDAKVKAYCTANPKAKVMDAVTKAMGG